MGVGSQTLAGRPLDQSHEESLIDEPEG
jgi:hypothetical protein